MTYLKYTKISLHSKAVKTEQNYKQKVPLQKGITKFFYINLLQSLQILKSYQGPFKYHVSRVLVIFNPPRQPKQSSYSTLLCLRKHYQLVFFLICLDFFVIIHVQQLNIADIITIQTLPCPMSTKKSKATTTHSPLVLT